LVWGREGRKKEKSIYPLPTLGKEERKVVRWGTNLLFTGKHVQPRGGRRKRKRAVHPFFPKEGGGREKTTSIWRKAENFFFFLGGKLNQVWSLPGSLHHFFIYQQGEGKRKREGRDSIGPQPGIPLTQKGRGGGEIGALNSYSNAT